MAQASTDFSVLNGRRWADAQQAILSGDDAAVAAALQEQVKHLDSEGQNLGFSYASAALLPDGTRPFATASQAYVPSATPGARAPRIWLRRLHAGTGPATPLLSTLDLFEQRSTLLTGPREEAWRSAGRRAARDLGLPLCAYVAIPRVQPSSVA